MQMLSVGCRCGLTKIQVLGKPITAVICACNSCRRAAQRFEQAEGAPPVLRTDGGIDYCLYRKDRVRIIAGSHLQEHRLTAASPTRRLVAQCCNTPMFVDFTPGHWVTLYRDRIPGERPPIEYRTMAKDAPADFQYNDGIPTYATHPVRLMAALLRTWAAMRFRRPKLTW